jgi:hypothetical protein
MGFEEIIFYKKMTHISDTNMMIGFSIAQSYIINNKYHIMKNDK